MRLPALLFSLILLTYLVAGGLYATLTPAWQAPDEPAHYNYIRTLATEFRFPELVPGCYDQAYLGELTARRFPPELPIDGLCYEFHQPPLYYLLAAPVFLISNGSLLALRLFSVTLGAGVVTLAYFIGRTICPQRPAIALGTMAFVAFVPMHVAILSSVNNDALAELIFAAILLKLTQGLMSVVSRRSSVAPAPQKSTTNNRPLTTDKQLPITNYQLPIILGLALLTKMTVYIAVPLIVLALWLESGRDWLRLARRAVLVYGLALLIALPWYVRNALLYGNFDLLGLIRHDAVVVGQLRTAAYVAEVGLLAYLREFVTVTFRSFWGQFGWMAVPMDGRTYHLLTILTLIAVGGLAIFTIYDLRFTIFDDKGLPHPVSRAQKQGLTVLAAAIALMLLAYSGYNLSFKQLQGRYLFPVIIPLGLFFTLGLSEAFAPRRGWWLAGGLGLALVWIAVASLRSGGLDKWGLLIVGLALAGVVARTCLARRWPVPAGWLVAGCYAGLALLTLLGPFWFVVPYLSL